MIFTTKRNEGSSFSVGGAIVAVLARSPSSRGHGVFIPRESESKDGVRCEGLDDERWTETLSSSKALVSRKVADLRVSPDWPMAFSVAGDWPALANLPPRLDAPLFNKQRELSMNPLLNQATLQTVDNGRDAPFRSGMRTQSMP